MDTTDFLNVDLEIASLSNLDPLAAELTPLLFELYRGREAGMHRAHYQIPGQTTTLDATILKLIRPLRKLSPKARKLWKAARIRDFNIGIKAGQKPLFAEFMIEPKTLHAISALGGRVVVTVYAKD